MYEIGGICPHLISQFYIYIYMVFKLHISYILYYKFNLPLILFNPLNKCFLYLIELFLILLTFYFNKTFYPIHISYMFLKQLKRC